MIVLDTNVLSEIMKPLRGRHEWCSPSGGPDSVYQQELRLERDIELIIEDEWQRIEQS